MSDVQGSNDRVGLTWSATDPQRKKLEGVQAGQTLSRVNRTALGKTDTFVLDVVNSAEDITVGLRPRRAHSPACRADRPGRRRSVAERSRRGRSAHKCQEQVIVLAQRFDQFPTVFEDNFRPDRMINRFITNSDVLVLSLGSLDFRSTLT